MEEILSMDDPVLLLLPWQGSLQRILERHLIANGHLSHLLDQCPEARDQRAARRKAFASPS